MAVKLEGFDTAGDKVEVEPSATTVKAPESKPDPVAEEPPRPTAIPAPVVEEKIDDAVVRKFIECKLRGETFRYNYSVLDNNLYITFRSLTNRENRALKRLFQTTLMANPTDPSQAWEIWMMASLIIRFDSAFNSHTAVEFVNSPPTVEQLADTGKFAAYIDTVRSNIDSDPTLGDATVANILVKLSSRFARMIERIEELILTDPFVATTL